MSDSLLVKLVEACGAARDRDELARLALPLILQMTGASVIGLETAGWSSTTGPLGNEPHRLPLGQGGRHVGTLVYDGPDANPATLSCCAAVLGPSLAALIALGDQVQYQLELTTLQQLAGATRSSLDLDEMLGRCLDLTTLVSNARGAVIHLLDGDRYVMASVRNIPEPVLLPMFPDALIGGIFDKDPDKFDNLISDMLAYGSHPSLTNAISMGIKRLTVLPLRAEGQRIGILSLFLDRAEPFSPSMMATVEAVAQQQAVFIANAHAHRLVALRARLSRRLSEFGERALSTVELGALDNLVLETALEISGCDRGLLALVESGSTRVVCGLGVDRALVGMVLPIDATYLPEALAGTQPFTVEDTSALDPRSAIGGLARANGTGAFVLSPMRRQQQPVGLLFVGCPSPRRFQAEEVEALKLLASMSAEARERCLAAERVEDERRILSATIEHLPIIVCILGREAGSMMFNAAGRVFVEEFIGGADRWEIGLDSIDAFRPGDTTPIPSEDRVPRRAFRGELVPPTELVLRNLKGLRMPVLAVAAPIDRDLQNRVRSVVVAFFDITRMRDLVDEKDRFLRMASHELRSPITSLRATTHLLEMDPLAISDPQRRQVLLGRAQRQIDRLIKLVEQLIDGARLGGELPIDSRDCDLCEVVKDGVELALAAVGAQPARVTLELPDKLCGIWDAGHLEQAVVNLVSNALRYSGEQAIAVTVSGDKQSAYLKVEDHGIGIPDNAVDKIFRPFFRAANASLMHKGLGLGMHITSEIVRRHGGRIEVASTVGVGTTFTVTLPRKLP